MKWPKQVLLNSRLWEIRYVKEGHALWKDTHTGESEALLGYCEESKGIIVINADQGDETKRDTIIHEMLHAIYARLPGVDHDDVDAEENFVLAATLAFFEIVRNTGRWYLPDDEA